MLPVGVNGEATVRFVEPLTGPEDAAIVVTPVPALVARPLLSIFATLVADEFHVAALVTFGRCHW
jgi:hypothetical protein